MLEKFKMILFFIFFSSMVTLSIGKKNLFMVINFDNNLELNDIFFINYIFDYCTEKVLQENTNVNIFSNGIELETDNIKNIVNYVILKKGIGFFFIYCFKKEDKIYINLKLYSLRLENLYEKEIVIEVKNNIEIEHQEKNAKLIKYISEGINIILQKKYNVLNIKIRDKNVFKHDFSFLSFMLSSVSVKMYFDGRTNSKLFSFFPVSFYLVFYPLKYFETGAFISFDFENFIFKYRLNNLNDYNYFYSSFVLFYGFFAGFSFFFDIYHYSIGISFYNIYYNLKENTGLIKPPDYRGYFLPQISFYGKLDIKIFKILNYSLYISIKTLPLFIKENNYFYSNPFLFDFFIVEFSILGFSITI